MRKSPVIALGEVLLLGRSIVAGELPHYLRAARHVIGRAPALLRERRTIAGLGELKSERVEQFVSRRMPPVSGSLDRIRRPRRGHAVSSGGVS